MGSRLRAMTEGFTLRVIGALGTVLFAALLPLLLTEYHIFQLTLILSYSLAILGLNMLVGYNGQMSLGHGAFYALGAYACAILMTRYGLPWYFAMVCAAIISFAFGFVFGFPALRLEGHHLALATFALAIATPQLLKYEKLEYWTGGTQGIVLLRGDPPAWIAIDPGIWFYLVTLAITVVMFWFASNLLGGRIGAVMLAIRDQPIAASTVGIDVAFYKMVTFGLSALYTGLAGALGALCIQYVAPDSFELLLSIALLVGVAIGGLATIYGAFLGALFIVLVPNLANDVSTAAPWAIYGAILIAFMILMPDGLAGLTRRGLAGRLRSIRPSELKREADHELSSKKRSST
jgi:branched-chain amino acid transport system permease protein